MLWNLDPAASAALHEQISASVRRAVADGDLAPGERLPPAAELAAALGVNANTVLLAFRRLRAEGLLEFRRGRGIRVAADATAHGQVVDAAQALLEVGRRHGYNRTELQALLGSLAQAR